uniref:DM2 domain-containing protein n=1 Tax=viral metagenome TaxID=1070528 RepID=A0A6C0I359_9ZZZZ
MVKTKTSSTLSADSSAAVSATPTVSASAEGASKLKKLPKPKSVACTETCDSSMSSTAPVNVVTSSSSDAPTCVAVACSSSDSSCALLSMYSEYSSKLQAAHATWNTLRSEFRILERQTARELKNAQKASQKKKRKTGNRAPSGFVKPTLISNELAGFLGKPEGSEMARTEVTREINKYIRTNNLQDKENGRKINPDKKLTSLLKLKKGDELTYFNLQRYMSPHFAKSAAAQAAAAAAAPVATASS